MSLNTGGDLIVRHERFQLHVEKKTGAKNQPSYEWWGGWHEQDAGEGKCEGKGKHMHMHKCKSEGEDGDEYTDEAEAEGRTDGEGGTRCLSKKRVAGPNIYALAGEMEAGKARKGKGKAKDWQGQNQGQPDNQGEQDEQDEQCERWEQERQEGEKVAWKLADAQGG
ncbi:hypothetical protein FRC06_003533 [Ceratobasidium sp. 370]|nr:hypothetical protein FRC06_003533 [Ceratobasidium sp. 370]